MKTTKLFLMMAISMVISKANAGVLVEPYVGYESGSVKCEMTGGTACDHNTTGLNFGARLGYKMANPIWFAVDFNSASPTAKYNSTGVADDKVTRTVSGVSIGYDPGHFRMWLGYGSSAEVKYVDTASPQTTTDRTLKSGTATKLGVGYEVHHMVSLNLEYSIEKYTKFEQDGVTYDQDVIFTTNNASRMIFSVSFPWNVGGK